MNRLLGAVCAAFVVLAGSVQAREVKVAVDARCGPWSMAANKKMKYGVGDALPPVIVTGLPAVTLSKLEVYVDGTTMVDGKVVDALGIADTEVNDTKGRHGKFYPSFYTPKILYPAQAHALIGGFVDTAGVLVSRPFVIGNGVRVAIPENATGLALGFNDESFARNSGALSVTVNIPEE